MKRHDHLAELHKRYQPRTYLEIGVNNGRSLALSRVRTIGIDPEFKVTAPLSCDLRLVKATSDDYFDRTNAVKFFPRRRIDLAFIDGMHLFEFALRDFINVEHYSRWTSVAVLDDMLPRDVDEAARERHTTAWAGDVYKVAEVLRELRPDLVIVPVDTRPTGQVVVLGLDSTSTVLRDHYDEMIARFVVDDPQDVPRRILDREDAVDPKTFLAAPFWRNLRRARDRRIGRRGSWEELRPQVLEAVETARAARADRVARRDAGAAASAGRS